MESYQDSQSGQIARDMTLDEMAARIGSTREMVCRVLCRLADQGAIRINSTEFTIEDSEVLTTLAETERGQRRNIVSGRRMF